MFSFVNFWEFTNTCINNIPDELDINDSLYSSKVPKEYLKSHPKYKFEFIETPKIQFDASDDSLNDKNSPHKLRYKLYRKKSARFRSLMKIPSTTQFMTTENDTITGQIGTQINKGFEIFKHMFKQDSNNNNNNENDILLKSSIKNKQYINFTDASSEWSEEEENQRLKICISSIMQMIFFDQLAYSGILVSLTLFARTKLKISTQVAASFVSVFTAMGYWTPLVAAYFADAQWGRSKTILVAQIIFLIGSVLLVFSSVSVNVLLFYISSGI